MAAMLSPQKAAANSANDGEDQSPAIRPGAADGSKEISHASLCSAPEVCTNGTGGAGFSRTLRHGQARLSAKRSLPPALTSFALHAQMWHLNRECKHGSFNPEPAATAQDAGNRSHGIA